MLSWPKTKVVEMGNLGSITRKEMVQAIGELTKTGIDLMGETPETFIMQHYAWPSLEMQLDAQTRGLRLSSFDRTQEWNSPGRRWELAVFAQYVVEDTEQ